MWTLAVQNSDAACFPFEPVEKYTTFKDIFTGLSRTSSFNLQDFPGPKWFSGTFYVLEFSRTKNPGLSRSRVNPDLTSLMQKNSPITNLLSKTSKRTTPPSNMTEASIITTEKIHARLGLYWSIRVHGQRPTLGVPVQHSLLEYEWRKTDKPRQSHAQFENSWLLVLKYVKYTLDEKYIKIREFNKKLNS